MVQFRASRRLLVALSFLTPLALSSTPAGATWSELSSGTTSNLLDVQFPLDETTGYAVGASGTILKTTDGGATWVAQSSGISVALRGVDFPLDDATGYAVGASGTILQTTDGGASWQPQSSQTPFALWDVQFPAGADSGFAVGASGSIQRTPNGGAQWFGDAQPTLERFEAVDFPQDATTGFVVGGSGLVVKTTDGGTNWAFLPSGLTQDLSDVDFPVDATTGWVVGVGGFIAKTTNGGSNWTTQTSGTAEDLKSIHFPTDELEGFVVGAAGTILRTTDGGGTWAPEASPVTNRLRSVYFPAPSFGYAVGDSGRILVRTSEADLALTKSADATIVGEGSNLNYTIVLTNDGPGLAAGVEITDVLPSGVTFQNATATQGAYDEITGLWTVGTLSNGASDTLTITVTVDAGTAGSMIQNAAHVSGSDSVDPNPANDFDTADVTVVALTMSSSADQVFLIGDASTAIRSITITDDASIAVITAANDLRLRIPAGFSMSWDSADLTATITGPAAAKVASTVTYEDADATVVLDVVSDFAAGDEVTVSELAFRDFASTSAMANLELEIGNDGLVAATDDRFVAVLARREMHSTAIDVSPNGNEVWVVNPDHGTVSVIATQGANANTVLAEIPVGREPWSLDISPLTGEVWVGSLLDDHVYVIDGSSRTVIDSVAAGFETFGVAFDPRGLTVLVTASGSDEIFAIDALSRTVIANLADTETIYRRPRGIAWRKDGSRAWVTHLLMPESIGRLSAIFPATWTISPRFIGQVFAADFAGYPSTMQNIVPEPGNQYLWIPNNMINTSAGPINGTSLSPTNIVHSTIRAVDMATGADLPLDTYFLSEEGSPNVGYPGTGTPVGGAIAVAFKAGRAYVANLHSDNVTVIDDDLFSPTEIGVIPVGSAPIGVIAHKALDRVYVANWLSRDVTVIDSSNDSIVATVPTTATEPLPAQILNGKRLFFTSTGNMSLDGRGACASCHVFGRADSRPWDLSQFGKSLRSTPDLRGIGFTGAHDWTSDKDEMADHNFGIIEFMGGPGLIPGGGNPPLGPPNDGLSQDMDDIGRYMANLTHRSDTPFLEAGGAQTAAADSGEVLFNDVTVGCVSCHAPPFYTDSQLSMPFVKHDVGTADSTDTDATPGLDTPSLVGAWDTGPYLHHHRAQTIEDVMTTFNPNDQHGVTSHLSPEQIGFIAEFVRSIGWPDAPGPAVDSPLAGSDPLRTALHAAYPNPFDAKTSLRFSVEIPASRVNIEIFNVEGRRVRALLDRAMARGTHVVGWDSRDDGGRFVGPGIYFARLSVNGERTGVKKMTVLRR